MRVAVCAGRDKTHLVSLRAAPMLESRKQLTTQLSSIEFRDVGITHYADKPPLMDLLLKFFVPSEGQILVDGNDIGLVSEEDVRKRDLLATHETTIFNDTVRNNIKLGADVPDEQISNALAVACANELVELLPQGLDTALSYVGSNLSGGQWLGLARAIARSPDVLLFDESTSARYVQTRVSVVASVITEFLDKILVFVTHDGHVMRSVDTVLRMEDIVQTQAN